MKALVGHAGREHDKEDRTEEASHCVDLTGAEREPTIPGIAPSERIREEGDSKGHRMGRHVDAIGGKGHGAESETGRNLHDHGRRGVDDHSKRSPFAGLDSALPEGVIVLPPREIIAVHVARSPVTSCPGVGRPRYAARLGRLGRLASGAASRLPLFPNDRP